MKQPLFRAFAFSFLALASAASAQATAPSTTQIENMISRGDYRAAAQAGTALGTSEGLALAAQATSYLAAAMPAAQRIATYEQAINLASRAVELNTNNAEAYFERARATGRVAQVRGILESLGLARGMKADLDRAIALNSSFSSAYVALALWNAELVSKGLIASSATGASAAQVRPNLDRAIALDPQNPTYRLEYGRALLAIAGRNNRLRTEARTLVQQAANMTPRTAIERADVAAAQEMLRNWR